MKDIEIIQQHELQDVYRLQSGYILKVNKYDDHGCVYWVMDRNKKKLKKIAGLKNLYKVTEEIIDSMDNVYPVDSLFYDSRYIVPIQNKQNYWFELKMNGAFIGSFKEMEEFQEKIASILNLYLYKE